MSLSMIIPLATAGIILITILMMYNGLIGKKNAVENAFAGIDTQLKKRYDLIPNLISAVKQYMTHEKELLENITQLRTKAVSGQLNEEEKVQLDNEISQSMKGIMVAVENYPDLKADTQFTQLQKSLNEVESQISAARRAYNSSVTDYNNAVEMFPSSLIAGVMHYSKKTLFEIPENERQNINVGNLFNS